VSPKKSVLASIGTGFLIFSQKAIRDRPVTRHSFAGSRRCQATERVAKDWVAAKPSGPETVRTAASQQALSAESRFRGVRREPVHNS